MILVDIPPSQFTQHGLKSVLTLTPRTPADYGKVRAMFSRDATVIDLAGYPASRILDIWPDF
jgi:hypothetical protein